MSATTQTATAQASVSEASPERRVRRSSRASPSTPAQNRITTVNALYWKSACHHCSRSASMRTSTCGAAASDSGESRQSSSVGHTGRNSVSISASAPSSSCTAPIGSLTSARSALAGQLDPPEGGCGAGPRPYRRRLTRHGDQP
nr:hypothetical protein [Nonomuraea terrae]